MNKYFSQQGFTIIETLVAITILMVAIVGPLTIAHKGLLAAVYARDQVGASYLAQDAMEYLKNVRDNNLNKSRDWLFGLSGCVSPQNYCTIDTISGVPSADAPATIGIQSYSNTPPCVANASQCRLHVGSSGFSHSTADTLTQYYRYFYVIPQSGNDGAGGLSTEAKLVVVVSWKTGTIANVVTFENEIFDAVK